jgi:hypothetical protein
LEVDVQQGKFKILWLLPQVLILFLVKKWIPPTRSETAEIGQKTEGILGVKKKFKRIKKWCSVICFLLRNFSWPNLLAAVEDLPVLAVPKNRRYLLHGIRALPAQLFSQPPLCAGRHAGLCAAVVCVVGDPVHCKAQFLHRLLLFYTSCVCWVCRGGRPSMKICWQCCT